jgi:hypothetical protein
MGFADPLALAFSGLVGVLVFFYLWQRTQTALIVPSLLLWQALREDIVRARRFRPDVLFFLQLLLLLALIAGLARPYLRSDQYLEAGARFIVVLDSSASMQAVEGRVSRFEQARAAALDLVADLRPADEVMLVEAGGAPRVSVDFTRDRAVIDSALRQAVATDAAGDLMLAIEYAQAFRLRSDVPAHLAVFTDMPRETLPVTLRDEIRHFQFGETDDNIGIEALQVFQGRFQDYRSARVYVGVENFSHAVKHGVLSVSLDDRVVDRRGFTIPARESAGFLIRRLPGPGRVTAVLDGTDALAADNVAYGSIRTMRKPRILLVSAPGALRRDFHRLAVSNGMSVTDADPKQFDLRMVDGFDLAIFHQFVPAVPPDINALYIFPPDGPLFRVFGEAQNVEILDWDAHHAVLESVEPLSSLPLRRARVVTLPSWSRGLLWSRTAGGEFPLAFAGERGGARTAYIGFDLAGERLLANDNLDLFLFFMNLLGWLLPVEGGATVLPTGSVWASPSPPAEALEVRAPGSAVMTLPVGADTIELPFAGAYTVQSGKQRYDIFANFFAPAESDIGRAARPSVAEQVTQLTDLRVADTTAGRRPLFTWFYAFAAAFLLVEWVVAWRLR